MNNILERVAELGDIPCLITTDMNHSIQDMPEVLDAIVDGFIFDVGALFWQKQYPDEPPPPTYFAQGKKYIHEMSLYFTGKTCLT
eukprot:5623285-Karenia_brevis.AAC.1